MLTTVDSAGRVVIPKALRERLGLTLHREVEMVDRGGYLELAPTATPMRLEQRDGVPVAVSDQSLPPLTTEAVRDVLESMRR